MPEGMPMSHSAIVYLIGIGGKPAQGASARDACPVSNFDQDHGETHRCGNQKEPEPDFQPALWQAMRKASAKGCDVARYWCDHDDADHRDKADREGRQQILMR